MRMPSPELRRSLAAQVERWHAALDGRSVRYLLARGIDKQAAEHFQLGYDGDRLVIPYLTPAGPWYVKRRCIRDHVCDESGCTKYLAADGAELHLFNARALIGAQRVAVVEGELDAVIVQTQLGIPTVAIPGSKAWSSHRYWRHLFDSAVEIVVVGDGDTDRADAKGKVINAGRDLARDISKDLRQAHPATDVRMVVLPLGQHPDGTPKKTDSTSFICDYGVDAYRELVKL